MDLRPSDRVAAQLSAQLLAVQCAVRDHQDPGARCRSPPARLGRRFLERPATVRVLGGNLANEAADDGADKQCDADERIDERTKHQRDRDERRAAHRDVKGVGFAADRVSHIGSFVF
jgi:hypothetical protein